MELYILQNERGFKMDFFQKLGDTITVTGKQVIQKAQETADLARINSRILSEKDKIRTAHIAIGEKYYKEHQHTASEEYEDYIKVIKESNENIILLKKKIGRVKGAATCNFCGSEIAMDSNYCNYCGKRSDGVYDTENHDKDIFEDQ